MKNLIVFGIIMISLPLSGQPNCEAFKYEGDDLKYKACITAYKRAGHYQFSRAYQEALDEALAIDSTFAYAYRVKSTAYLKSGDFITWKKLIDKAVKYAPKEELFYRASCRYQFFRDYEGAIKDIELLDSLVDYDIGYSQNGDYHLNIIKALSYRALGNKTKALEIFENQLSEDNYTPGIYDYLHLAVLHMEMENYSLALEALDKQGKENDIAENRFYKAQIYLLKDDKVKAQENISESLKKYKNEIRMFDPYVEKMDQIYLSDIEALREKLK